MDNESFIFVHFDKIIFGSLFLYIILRLLITKLGLRRRFGSKRRLDNKTPLLMALYTLGHSVSRVKSGVQDGVNFHVYMTTDDSTIKEIDVMNAGAVIYMLELGFNTEAHLVGLGNNAAIDKIKLQSFFDTYQMERVHLEGNFNAYFDLYAANGQQAQSRYVFDPEAMQSFMTYCQYNFWEIVGDEMYVVISRDHDKSSLVITHSKEFLSQIRPAVIKNFGEGKVHHDKSYGVYSGDAMHCPLCGADLSVEKNVHICPNGHGVLLAGKELIQLRKDKLSISLPVQNPVDHDENIICPNCKNEMSRENYSGGGVIIDTCQHCIYRWLDSTEIEKVINRSNF